MTNLVNELITTVFVAQPLASLGSTKQRLLTFLFFIKKKKKKNIDKVYFNHFKTRRGRPR